MLNRMIHNGFRWCGAFDTRCSGGVTSPPRQRLSCVGLTGLCLLLAGCASSITSSQAPRASARPGIALRAQVIWHRLQFVYVALEEWSEAAPGDTLRFESGNNEIAVAEVVQLTDGQVAVARFVSGTLSRERRLERLRVTLLRRALPVPSALRVGVPSSRRVILSYGCGPWTLRPPLGLAYRIESTGRLRYRMTRDLSRDSTTSLPMPGSWAARATSWPDTIVVNAFEDAAEQEIALERGDLDVALFAPGELSTRMLKAPRWQDRLLADGGALAESAADSSMAMGMAIRGVPFVVLTPPDLVPYIRTLRPENFLRMLDCGVRRRGE